MAVEDAAGLEAAGAVASATVRRLCMAVDVAEAAMARHRSRLVVEGKSRFTM